MANVRTISGTVNTHQGCAATSRLVGSGSGAGMGRQSTHAGRLGAGSQQATGAFSDYTPQHPQCSNGGQASLGLSALPGAASHPASQQSAAAQAGQTPAEAEGLTPHSASASALKRKARRRRLPERKITLRLVWPDGTLWRKIKLSAYVVRAAEEYAQAHGRTFEGLVVDAVECFARDGEERLAACRRVADRQQQRQRQPQQKAA